MLRCTFSRVYSLRVLRENVLVEYFRIEPDAAFPGHRRGLGVHRDFLELAHVAPQLEGADLEQVAEEYTALQAIVETQPELVVVFRLARSHSMHRLLLPVARAQVK